MRTMTEREYLTALPARWYPSHIWGGADRLAENGHHAIITRWPHSAGTLQLSGSGTGDFAEEVDIGQHHTGSPDDRRTGFLTVSNRKTGFFPQAFVQVLEQ